jgi:prepilin-type processing-associated H-X9-DG protein
MKRGFTLWQLIGLLALLGIIAAILFPVFARKRENDGHRNPCQSNLKNIGLAFQQYLQDYDEKFPPVASGGAAYGWADALQPYLKSTQIFQCASEPDARKPTTNPRVAGYTDYWYNVRLAKLKQSEVTASALTFLSGDGNDGSDKTDARYAISTIPKTWIGNNNSPLYRHLEGANYGYVDGHVRWHAASQIEALDLSASPKAGSPTFAWK